jgi:Asp-tRNA(Asn)/Glu-tRNA(Gln) amidotransferase A subunit family amidase
VSAAVPNLPRPADQLAGYAVGAFRPDAAPPTPPPEIMMALADRIRARRSGELSAQRWRDVDDAWFRVADRRYNAVVARHPLPLQAPPLRIGVKDTVDVAGFPTTLGLRHHRHHPRETVGALRELDPGLAAVVAKVVTTELNIGVGSGCVNPYIPDIDPAGSSTGAGVAVAAGLCDLALGTDVLGSVRWPAGHTGTVGLRTTHRTSALNGVFPLCPPMDALGWVARSAEDLAVAADALAPRVAGPSGPNGSPPVTVGVVAEALDASSPVMAAAARAAEQLLIAVGYRTREVELGNLWDARGPAWELCAREAWDAYLIWRDWIDVELKESTHTALEVGSEVGDDRYRTALDSLRGHRAGIGDRFEASGADVWLMPLDPNPPPSVARARSTTSTIPRRGDDDYAYRVGFTPVASFAGLPALTLPVRRGESDGAPLCVQLVGRPGADHALIGLARAIERHRPDLHFVPS